MIHVLIVLSAAVAWAQTPTARPNPNADAETIALCENGRRVRWATRTQIARL
jgi:hypothetical protein